ncbi:hypothetical protein EJB05_11812, partial [Eragrostis curvula]
MESMKDEGPRVARNQQGKYWGIFICWILGNGCLVAMNSMLTIEDYFIYLFPKYHPIRVITLTYQPFVITTSAIFTCRGQKVNTRLRNLVGYSLFFLSSLALVILDLATSGRGGLANFIGVCIIVAAFGVAGGHVEGAMYGDLSLMCPEFIQSFSAGLAASGAITSGLRLVTKAAFENSRDGLRKGAILFFSISCLFELVCVLLYAYVFPKLPIVKFYRSKAASEGCLTVAADLDAGGIKTHPDRSAEAISRAGVLYERLSNKQLLVQNMDYALGMFLIYVLTLSIFPGFLAEDIGSHSLGSWYALVLIASYNAGDLVGRYLPLIERINLVSRRGLAAAVVARFALVPAFYYVARRGGSDGVMVMLTSVLGLSNGYLTVCIFTEAPKGHKGPEQNALGNLLVFCLLAGIFSGAALDWLWLIGKGCFFTKSSLSVTPFCTRGRKSILPHGTTFSVFDFIWEEIKIIANNPLKSCGYAPYIMLMIEKVTGATFECEMKHLYLKVKVNLKMPVEDSGAAAQSHEPSSSRGPSREA